MKYVFYSLLCVFLVGCMTYKPDSGYVSNPDHNKVVSITNPHYKKRPTVLGYGAMGLAAAGGAYLGYTANDGIFVRQDAEGRKPNRIANGALGALLGFASVSLTLNLSGMNKVTPSTNFQSWLHDADNSYVNCSNSLTSQNMALPRTMERDFNVKSINDVRIFYAAYGSSIKKEEVFNDGLGVVKRYEIPDLIDLYPLSNNVSGAQKRYYELSESITEILEAKSRYPDIVFDVEKKASELVKYLSDAEMFFKQYTNKSRYADAVFDKLVPTLDLSEIVNLIALHPNANNRNKAIDQAVSKVKTMNDIETLIQFKNTHGNQLEKIGEDIILADIYSAEKKFDAFLALFPKSNRLRTYDFGQYFGQWDQKTKKPEGLGIYMKGLSSFIGQFSKGKLHGENCIEVKRYNNGTYFTYKGRFENGKLNGAGKMVYGNDIESYEGNFKNGERHGEGQYCGKGVMDYFPYFMQKNLSKGCYTGEWQNDLPHGRGNLKSTTNEDAYVGSFKKGKYDGDGTLYVNAYKIKGKFKDGEPNGDFEVTYNKFSGLPLIGSFLGEKTQCYATDWVQLAPCMQIVLDNDNKKNQRYADEERKENAQNEINREIEKNEKCVKEYKKKFKPVDEKPGIFREKGTFYRTEGWLGNSSYFLFQEQKSGKWYYRGALNMFDEGPYISMDEAISAHFCK